MSNYVTKRQSRQRLFNNILLFLSILLLRISQKTKTKNILLFVAKISFLLPTSKNNDTYKLMTHIRIYTFTDIQADIFVRPKNLHGRTHIWMGPSRDPVNQKNHTTAPRAHDYGNT